eukprot:scpid11356/ scgid20339/ 
MCGLVIAFPWVHCPDVCCTRPELNCQAHTQLLLSRSLTTVRDCRMRTYHQSDDGLEAYATYLHSSGNTDESVTTVRENTSYGNTARQLLPQSPASSYDFPNCSSVTSTNLCKMKTS